MKRRINSTGRKKILLSDIKIEILEASAGEPLRAKVGFELESYAFPPEAKVVVEAYHRSSSQRFDLGTIGNLKIPPVLILDQVDHSGTVLFRIKVVDQVDHLGLLLGSAERVHPRSSGEEASRQSLFPVHYRDLRDEIWRVEFLPDARPTLILNNRWPEVQHQLKIDPVIRAFMLPAAFRLVMEKLILDPDEEDEIETDWRRDWKEFCKTELGIRDAIPGLGAEQEEKEEWVDRVVARFCEKHKFLKRLQNLEG